uniref:Uncharacterized protein n=1 Tax=Gopherus evgoodei TaxID=1825980 RepID=A0A8C4YHB6_9SAUR
MEAPALGWGGVNSMTLPGTPGRTLAHTQPKRLPLPRPQRLSPNYHPLRPISHTHAGRAGSCLPHPGEGMGRERWAPWGDTLRLPSRGTATASSQHYPGPQRPHPSAKPACDCDVPAPCAKPACDVPAPGVNPTCSAPIPAPSTKPACDVPAPGVNPACNAPIPAPSTNPACNAPVPAPSAKPACDIPAPGVNPACNAPIPAPSTNPACNAPVPAPSAKPACDVPAPGVNPACNAPIPAPGTNPACNTPIPAPQTRPATPPSQRPVQSQPATPCDELGMVLMFSLNTVLVPQCAHGSS